MFHAADLTDSMTAVARVLVKSLAEDMFLLYYLSRLVVAGLRLGAAQACEEGVTLGRCTCHLT